METLEAEERYVKLDFTLDDGISHRAAIGLVVLATDHTIEYEWRKLLAIQGVGFYESRIMNAAEITPETLREMDTLIAPGVEVIPCGVPHDCHGVEIVHSGSAEGAVGGRKTGRPDNVRFDAETCA